MPITADIEGVGTAEFPDDASPEEITKLVNEHFPKPVAEGFTPKSTPAAQPEPEPPENDWPENDWVHTIGYKPKKPIGWMDAIREAVVDTGKQQAGAIEPIFNTTSLIPEGSLTSGFNHYDSHGRFIASDFEKLVRPLATPQNAVITAATAGGGTIAKLAQVGFGAMAAKGIYDAAKVLADPNAMYDQKHDAVNSLFVNVPMAAGGAMAAIRGIPKSADILPRAKAAAMETIKEKGTANASSQQETTTVHGDVQPLEKPASELPLKEGGEGVQPQTEKVAEKAQIPLTHEQTGLDPEHHKLLMDEIERGGHDVEIVTGPIDPNNPFARQVGTIDRATGKILINPQQLAKWLKNRGRGGVPEGQERKAIRSLLNEETIHLHTTDEDALKYLATLTRLEVAIGQRVYAGRGGARLSPKMLGHELVRQRMQKLMRMSVRETIEASRKERWTVKSLLALSDLIRKVREMRGTMASEEGREIMDRLKANIDGAITDRTGQAPGATAKGNDKDKDITPEFTSELAKYEQMSPEDFTKQKSTEFGSTEAAYKLGQGLKSEAELNELAAARDRLYAKGREFSRKGQFSEASQFLQRGSLLREAYQAATGTKSAGKALREANPDYKPPFPEGEAEETPGARRKGQEEKTPEFYLPPVEGQVERPTAAQSGALPEVKIPPEKALQTDTVHWNKPNAWRRVTNELLTKPYSLGKQLTEGSRTGEGEPVSTTKRLVALEKNGKVDVVSIYPDAEDGARLVDPTKAGKTRRPNVSLKSLLDEGYKPIVSMLRTEGVQNFHRHFDSRDQFEQTVGKPGDDQWANVRGYEAQTAATQASSFGKGGEITDAEAGALHDHMIGHETPEQAVDSIAASEQKNEIRSAFSKAINQIMGRIKSMTREEAAGLALKEFYEQSKSADNRKGYIKSLLDSFGQESPESSGRPAEEYSEQAAIPTDEESEPAAVRKYAQDKLNQAKSETEDLYHGLLGTIRAEIARSKTKDTLSKLRDAADHLAGRMSSQTKREIALPSLTRSTPEGNPKVLSAARAINAAHDVTHRPNPQSPEYKYGSGGVHAMAYPNAGKLPGLLKSAMSGEVKAKRLLTDPTDQTLKDLDLEDITGMSRGQIKRTAKAWLGAAKELQSEVRYAMDHFGEHDLMETTHRLRREMGENLRRMKDAGIDVNEVENYLRGVYEGETWDDSGVHFGTVPSLGRMFAKPKTFANYYDAIEAGPFIPKSNNVADIAASSVSDGMRSVFKRQAFKAPLEMTDPKTGTPIAVEPVASKEGGYEVPPGGEQRTLVYMNGRGKPIAIRKGYANLINNLYGESKVPDWLIGKAGLAVTGALKHGFILIMDTFHPGRLIQYAAAITGKKAGYAGGYNVMEYRPSNMAEAVKKGAIPKSAMDWALGKETVYDKGQAKEMTRYDIAHMAVKEGLNAGKIQDALHKNFVDKWDVTLGGRKYGAGAYNRWLFDKFQRGLLTQTTVNEFVRLNKAMPGQDATMTMRRVVKDANTFYGSLGRQGLIKNPTIRDLTQMVFLAPQWVESQLTKEIKFGKRAVSAPWKLMTEGKAAANVNFGTVGKGMARGLVASFVLGQVINLITRHKTTFQNEEEGHELDAWAPDFEGGPGIFLPTTGMFMEFLTDAARLGMTKPKVSEAARQIGENKLGPIGRALLVGATGESPTHERYTTTAGDIKGAASQLAPVPISLGKFGQYGLSKATGLVSPPTRGSITRQLLSSAGFKAENAPTETQQISVKAKRFAEENGFPIETGWRQVETEEPSYSKLRSALANGDENEAKRQFNALRARFGGDKQADGRIFKAMKNWKDHPFTGSKKAEGKFIRSLDDRDLALYQRALEQQDRAYQQWEDFALKTL